MEQQPHGFDRGSTEHHQGGLHTVMLTIAAIDEDNTLGPVAPGIQFHMADHRIAADLHPAAGQRLPKGPPLGGGGRPGVPGRRGRQAEAPGMDQGEIELLGQLRLQLTLRRREGQGRQELTIRQLGQAIGMAVDAEETLQAVVVGIEIGAADRPDRAEAVPLRRQKLVIGEPQGDASPGQALTAHLATPGPEEGAIDRGVVGVLPFIDKQIGVLFPVARMVGLASLPTAAEVDQPAQAVMGLSPVNLLSRQGWASLQHQHLQACFR